MPDVEKNAHIRRALELFEDIKPEGSLEGMLAMQMVGTHSAAMECLRRAAIEELSFEGREMNLRHAQKLMSLYTQQVTALNKHRGKGQQKVTVEHVYVAAGGQAIVGNVKVGKPQELLALEMSTEKPIDMVETPMRKRPKHATPK